MNPFYTCPRCGSEFERKSNYQQHIFGRKDYPRRAPCRATYSNISIEEVKRQYENLPNYAERDIKTCRICNKEFTNLVKLKQHEIECRRPTIQTTTNNNTNTVNSQIDELSVKQIVENDTVRKQLMEDVQKLKAELESLKNIACNVVGESKLHDTQAGVYIIRKREFRNNNENIWKIGKTGDVIARFKQYDKNSELVYFYNVPKIYITELETKLRQNLSKDFQNRKDIGLEYFEADRQSFIKQFATICFEFIESK